MQYLFITFFLIGLYWLFKKSKGFAKPAIHFPSLKGIPGKKGELKSLAYWAALGCFVIAFFDPHYMSEQPVPIREIPKEEGIGIYLVLDRSGSMQQEFLTRTPKGRRQYRRKLDALQEVIGKFVQERPGDMIGLIAFARTSQVLAPLTLDHDEVLKQLGQIDLISKDEQEGTAIGYAIYKTANLISATREYAKKKGAYAIKNAIIILVTDGFQNPSPLDQGNQLRNIDLLEAANHAKRENVKLYLINIAPELATESFTPHRKLLEKVTEITEGKLYLAEDKETVATIYEDINQLEKSPLPPQLKFTYKRISFYPWLIGLGLLLVFFGVLLETAIMRSIP